MTIVISVNHVECWHGGRSKLEGNLGEKKTQSAERTREDFLNAAPPVSLRQDGRRPATEGWRRNKELQ